MSGIEIAEGVHRIDAEVGGRPLYLFLFIGERTLLLDAGCSTTVAEFILPYLEMLSLTLEDVDLLLISHSDLDHQGGAYALKQSNPRLLSACGMGDRHLVQDPEEIVSRRYCAYQRHGVRYNTSTLSWIRQMCGQAQPVDLVLVGGETVRLGANWDVRVLHVPGHSPGHLALLDTRSRAVFSGDCVQGSVYLGLDGTPRLCPTYTDVDSYLQTVALLEALSPSELHGCHWPAQRAAHVHAFLAETRGYVERMDEHVRNCISSRPQGLTLLDVMAYCNERLPEPWDGDAALELAYSVHGHLSRLERRGLVIVTSDGDGPPLFFRAS